MSDEYNYGPLEHQMAGGTDRSEFDKVFEQMEAPEYPATCDNCGEVGTNASMEQHECDGHDAPVAPERGERNDKMYTKSSRQTRQHIHTCMFCGQSGTEMSNEQHSTLITQRERLIHVLQAASSTLKSYQYGNVSPELAKEMIRTIEQVITTSEQEGRRER